MNIHHCVFKILGKNQSVTDGHTDRWTDNVKTIYPTTNKVCGGGYNLEDQPGYSGSEVIGSYSQDTVRLKPGYSEDAVRIQPP